MAKKDCTPYIHDVPRHIGKETRQFAYLNEHARDNKNIAVFYDDKATYSVMESPYSPDSISLSPTANKWEHISLLKKCEAQSYICWEVMYTLGPLRNRLSIAHYDNGGVTIMPPKGRYIHVIGEKNGSKTHLLVNTDSRKLCDVYGNDEDSHNGELGFYCLTEDWMSLSGLTDDAIESYMYECEHNISRIVLGKSFSLKMPRLFFSRYAYSSFSRNVYVSRGLKEFCDRKSLDLIQVCIRVDNDVDDYHFTEVRVVIGRLDATEFSPSEFGYAPCSNYLVSLDASKDDDSDEWCAVLRPPEGDALDLDNGVVSGYVDQDRKHEVSLLSVDPSVERLMIEEAERRLKL